MGEKKRPPSRNRSLKSRISRRASSSDFVRPREWAEDELAGVVRWIARLRSDAGKKYPAVWRVGMLRHYKQRARDLRVEIRAIKLAEKEAKPGSDPPPDVA